MIGVLLFLLLVNILQGAQASLGGSYLDWFLWDSVRELNFLLCSLLLYKQVSFSDPRKKLMCFLLFYVALWGTTSFFILSSGLESFYVTALLATISALPIVAHFCFKGFRKKSDKYTKKKSYLVYKRPVGVLGLVLVSLGIKSPGVALVVGGKEFCFLGDSFSSLKIEERNHMFSAANCYKHVRDVDIEYARKLIGVKWSPRRTCLRVFSDFDRPAPCG